MTAISAYPFPSFGFPHTLNDYNGQVQLMEVTGEAHMYELERLINDLKTLLNQGVMADLTIQSDSWSFRVHLPLLRIRCPTLAAHIDSQLATSTTPSVIHLKNLIEYDVTKAELQQILYFVYAGDASLETLKVESLLKVLKFALDFSIAKLTEACEDQILRNLHVDWTCTLSVLAKAHHLRMEKIINWGMYFFMRNFEKFTTTELSALDPTLQQLIQATKDSSTDVPKPPALLRKSYSHKSNYCKVSKDLKELLLSQESCDCTLEIQDETIKVHKFILAARSPFFNHVLKSGQDKLSSLKINMPMDCFKKVINYIYCGEYESFNQIDCLWILAECKSFLSEASELFQYCENHTENNISIDNCVETFAASSKLNIHQVKMKSLQFIMANYDVVGAKLEKYTGKSIL